MKPLMYPPTKLGPIKYQEPRKIFIHKPTGNLVEIGEVSQFVGPGICKISSYVKYGDHGRQIKLGFNLLKREYAYVGRV